MNLKLEKPLLPFQKLRVINSSCLLSGNGSMVEKKKDSEYVEIDTIIK